MNRGTELLLVERWMLIGDSFDRSTDSRMKFIVFPWKVWFSFSLISYASGLASMQ